MPGKCFIAGTVPPDRRPVAKAVESEPVTVALKDQVRPCWYMNDEVAEGTSATGARFVLMPAQRSTVPVAAPCEPAVVALPRLPIWSGERVGGAQGMRRTEPPSWSVAIRSGGCAPAA